MGSGLALGLPGVVAGSDPDDYNEMKIEVMVQS